MQERTYRIPLYLDDEFAAVVNDLHGRQLLPPAMQLSLEEHQRDCCNVPRMLSLVEQTRASTRRAARSVWTATETSEFRQRAITYDADRVRRTLERSHQQQG